MVNLGAATRIVWAPHLALKLDSGAFVYVTVDGRTVAVSDDVLLLLAAFSRPRTLAEGLEFLRPLLGGTTDWMQLSATALRLYRHGVLRAADAAAQPAAPTAGFEAPGIHIAMLNDRARTAGYIAAIREVVRPGDVVVDIGTGTGVLAVAAAQAGARRVYAVEAGRMGEAAQAVFAANGVADRVTLVNGWSTRVALPEKADVLVSEIIGNDPLGENVLEFTADACKRLVQPGARLIPQRVQIGARLLTVPPATAARHLFSAESTTRWHTQYGIDFTPLPAVGQPAMLPFALPPHEARDWPLLAEPLLIADIDLAHITDFVLTQRVEATVTQDGVISGIGITFRLDLAPGHVLAVDPVHASADCSWRMPVWLPTDPLPVRVGDRVAVTYRHAAPTQSPRVELARLA